MAHYELKDAQGAQLMSMDNMLLDDTYNIQLHSHPRLELSYIESGTGLYLIGEREYELRTGDIVLINNTELHRIMMRPGEKLLNTVIHFEPELIWNTVQCDMDYRYLQIYFTRSPSFSHVLDQNNPATGEIFRLLKEIEREFIEKKTGHELMVKAKLLTVFANIIRFYDYCRDETIDAIPEKDIVVMYRVIQYIKEHLTEELTLEALGKVANMSPSYFSTLFKRCNGISPFTYVTNQRINRAITLIHGTDRTIADIAFSCGFNTMSAFIKAFHKVTGNPPSFYRSKSQTE